MYLYIAYTDITHFILLCREPIELTFALIRERWRRIQYVNLHNIEKAPQIIMACCVLHNFCIKRGDHLSDSELDMEQSTHGTDMSVSNVSLDLVDGEDAEAKRQRIVNAYFR